MSVRSFDNPPRVPPSENAAWMIIGDRRPTDSVRDLVRLIEALSRRCSVVREGCDNRVEGKFWIRKDGKGKLERSDNPARPSLPENERLGCHVDTR